MNMNRRRKREGAGARFSSKGERKSLLSDPRAGFVKKLHLFTTPDLTCVSGYEHMAHLRSPGILCMCTIAAEGTLIVLSVRGFMVC